jgi:hypothetical protein
MDEVTSEVKAILATLDGGSENETLPGTRERMRKIKEVFLVKTFREVLLLMELKKYPKWMVLEHGLSLSRKVSLRPLNPLLPNSGHIYQAAPEAQTRTEAHGIVSGCPDCASVQIRNRRGTDAIMVTERFVQTRITRRERF